MSTVKSYEINCKYKQIKKLKPVKLHPLNIQLTV